MFDVSIANESLNRLKAQNRFTSHTHFPLFFCANVENRMYLKHNYRYINIYIYSIFSRLGRERRMNHPRAETVDEPIKMNREKNHSSPYFIFLK